MAADGISPALAIRSSVGVEVWSSASTATPYTRNTQFARDESKFCRAIAFSPDGRYLAWANGTMIQISTVDNWSVVSSLPRPKALQVQFSPLGNYIVTMELFTTNKDNLEGSPNFYVYETATGKEVYASIQKKNSDDWKPSWSKDESIFALMTGGEALFFETKGPDGFTKASRKIGSGRNGMLSLAGPGKTPHVAFYVPGVKDTPSGCKIYRYPALGAEEAIAAKSFFQADRLEMMWNKRGTGLILLTSTDVDQTGNSYYGKQALHFLSTRGDSCGISLSKEGPIHAVAWSPKSTEFCVIYGYMPSKATFFNLKCDPIFDVAEGPRNSIYYNDFGNIVLLAGFGNLRGNVEVWNASKKTLITTLQAPDSTMLEWCPIGETFVTATTAPRLRMGNGFKVWHYSGALLHETVWSEGQELLEVLWQKYAAEVCPEKEITNVKVQGIQSSQPPASKAIYIPPNARPGGAMAYSPRSVPETRGPIPGIPANYKQSEGQRKQRNGPKKRVGFDGSSNDTPLHTGNTRRSAAEPRGIIPGIPITYKQSQGQLKKQRNANREKTAADASTNGTTLHTGNANATKSNNEPQIQQPGELRDQQQTQPSTKRRPNNRNQRQPAFTTGDPGKDERIKVVQKKLKEILALKLRKESGENLQANQLSKINLESDLSQELNALKITA